MTADTLARGVLGDKPFDEALKDFTENRNGKYHTPAGEWLHAVLRPIFLTGGPTTTPTPPSSTGPRSC